MNNQTTLMTNRKDAALILKSGRCFFGKSMGKVGETIGEVCFTTNITGYQHTITDPSFAEQIIAFTFPHIGNVGINYKDYERKEILAKGVIVREASNESFHHSSYQGLESWLKEHEVVGISDIDTRALTRHLRKNGLENGIIKAIEDQKSFDVKSAQKLLDEHPSLNGMELASSVAKNSEPIFCNQQNNLYVANIVIVDFGMKAGIARCLINFGCYVQVVPGIEGFAQRVLSYKPDGVVLSNGPGDPATTILYAKVEIDQLIEAKLPIFGICFGHQLLAMAFGGKTTKMHHGHRGSNHPIFNLQSNRVEVTSQNHSFAVDINTLPSNIEVTHTSLFDGTISGISIKDYPAFSVQFHPEGSPGPHDSYSLFRNFIELIKSSI